MTVRGSGDINGDCVVNSGDVSELYKANHEGNSDGHYDDNGDGSVNVGNISELYKSFIGASQGISRLSSDAQADSDSPLSFVKTMTPSRERL